MEANAMKKILLWLAFIDVILCSGKITIDREKLGKDFNVLKLQSGSEEVCTSEELDVDKMQCPERTAANEIELDVPRFKDGVWFCGDCENVNFTKPIKRQMFLIDTFRRNAAEMKVFNLYTTCLAVRSLRYNELRVNVKEGSCIDGDVTLIIRPTVTKFIMLLISAYGY